MSYVVVRALCLRRTICEVLLCVLCLKGDFTVRSVNFIFQENYSYLIIFHNFLTMWHLDIAFIMNTLFVFIS